MSERMTLIEVECYDQDGLIAVRGLKDIMKMYQAIKFLELPPGYLPFVRLHEE